MQPFEIRRYTVTLLTDLSSHGADATPARRRRLQSEPLSLHSEMDLLTDTVSQDVLIGDGVLAFT